MGLKSAKRSVIMNISTRKAELLFRLGVQNRTIMRFSVRIRSIKYFYLENVMDTKNLTEKALNPDYQKLYGIYKKLPGRGVFRIIFFIPSIVSIVIYTMVYKYMFNPIIGPASKVLQSFFGWNESTTPVWFGEKNGIWMIMAYCLWVGTGYNILILGGAIANLPEEVMESAKLDGAKMRHELFLLVIPMIWPTISVAILGAVTTMFTLFLQVDLLTQGDAPTIAYLINSKIQGDPNSRSEAAAIGLTFTVIATPIILVVKKLLDKVSDNFGF